MMIMTMTTWHGLVKALTWLFSQTAGSTWQIIWGQPCKLYLVVEEITTLATSCGRHLHTVGWNPNFSNIS